MSAAASAATQAESVTPDKEELDTEKTQEEESPEFIEVPQEGIIVDDTVVRVLDPTSADCF